MNRSFRGFVPKIERKICYEGKVREDDYYWKTNKHEDENNDFLPPSQKLTSSKSSFTEGLETTRLII